MPDMKYSRVKYFGPIKYSTSRPKNHRTARLIRMCQIPECRNIYVTGCQIKPQRSPSALSARYPSKYGKFTAWQMSWTKKTMTLTAMINCVTEPKRPTRPRNDPVNRRNGPRTVGCSHESSMALQE